MNSNVFSVPSMNAVCFASIFILPQQDFSRIGPALPPAMRHCLKPLKYAIVRSTLALSEFINLIAAVQYWNPPVETPKMTESARPHKIFPFPVNGTRDYNRGRFLAARGSTSVDGTICEHSPWVWVLALMQVFILWKVIRYHHFFINSVCLVSQWPCRKNGRFHRPSRLMSPAERTWLRWDGHETREGGVEMWQKTWHQGLVKSGCFHNGSI